jgi:hypothetical protein
MNTGSRLWDCELSSIDTTLLLCGVLTCREYFPGHANSESGDSDLQSRELALDAERRFRVLYGMDAGRRLSELAVGPLLRIADVVSSGSRVQHETSSAFNVGRVQPAKADLCWVDLHYRSSCPLFIHQYSHAWFDFRNKRDKYANYFDHSITATQAHRLFCVSLRSHFKDYQPNLWGITSSDSANGYTAWGGPPPMGDIDASIVPCAAAGSLPFAPADCMAVLRTIYWQYPQAWQRYGFVDAFDPLTNWYDPDVIAIDAGITMLMAENRRSGLVWYTFMKNPEVQNAFAAVGLK